MKDFYVVNHTLSADLAADGTATLSYPSGTDAGTFREGVNHKAVAIGNVMTAPGDFTLTFNSGNITFTYGSGKTTIPEGSKLSVQLEVGGGSDFEDFNLSEDVTRANALALYNVNLGAPDTADADSMVKAATSTELPDTETVTYTPDTDGTTPTDGAQSVVTKDGVKYWELDVPRNVSVNTTHISSIVAMTVTVTGLDEYGKTMQEDITVAATGTDETDAGKKAFKWVRSIAFTAAADAEANTSSVGFADVIGLPVFLVDTGFVLKELEDGTAPTSGSLVEGDDAVATATTGDVRGTYDPNSAADGSKTFELVLAVLDPKYLGVSQFAG